MFLSSTNAWMSSVFAAFGLARREILLRQHHVLLVLVLVALDHVVPGHFLAGRLVHALVADRREVALVEHRHVEPGRAP
jgi:hypothetical protein